MKKSLLALAVLGAFTGIASAQTSVTIYGVVDAGITREDNGVTTTNRLDSGNQSGSRLGFKGNEDLGGGLSAQFLLEQGFNVDTGTLGQGGRMFGRQAYIGLTGNFGQLRLGRQKTVMYDALLAIDPFGIANKGGMDRLFVTNTVETHSHRLLQPAPLPVPSASAVRTTRLPTSHRTSLASPAKSPTPWVKLQATTRLVVSTACR